MQKIAVIADKTNLAQNVLAKIKKKYNFIVISEHDQEYPYDVVVVLGGDGFMLRCIHRFLPFNIPLYGLNCGTIGFLLNELNLDDLTIKIEDSVHSILNPLAVKITSQSADVTEKALAFNDVSLLRETRQSAWIKIIIDGKEKLSNLMGDGILVATAAGSSAYNFSVRGPIIPLSSDLLALTPIAPFRPRQWRGALLPGKTNISFVNLDPNKRKISALVDFFEYRDVEKVEIYVNKFKESVLLFNQENQLEDKILTEQFEMN